MRGTVMPYRHNEVSQNIGTRWGAAAAKAALLLALLLPLSPSSSSAEETTAKDLVVIDSEQGEPYRTVRSALFDALAANGYQEGKNLNVHYASLDNYAGRAGNLWNVGKLSQHKLFLIGGTVAAEAFKNLAFEDGQHSFIFYAVSDPVGMGLIGDFKHLPKANFTGVSYPVPVRERLRFVKRLFPKAHRIGFIYADMPQSRSYRHWLEQALRSDEEFKDMSVQFRMVPFVHSEGGHIRMARLAQRYVMELDGQVDVFLSPNDQMGVQRPFAEMVFQYASKPLIGIGLKEVVEDWGATATITPSLTVLGQQAAAMVKQSLDGAPLALIPPEQPKAFNIAIDVKKARLFGADLSSPYLKGAGAVLVDE